MRIGNRLFPYPVLNNDKNLSTFNDSNFEINFELEQDEDSLILKNIFYSLDNHYLNQLIQEGLVEVVTIVECSYTVFRKLYVIQDTPEDLSIPLSNLRDKVVISGYAYAKEDIFEYRDEYFDEDYHDCDFSIEKNSIIAIDDGVTTKIVYNDEEDNKLSSIFLVTKINDESVERVNVELTQKKIHISVREQEFAIYENLKNNEYLNNTFFSFFIMPALVYALEHLKKTEFTEIEFEFDWFESIKKQYKKVQGIELNEEEFEGHKSIEIAQIVMGNPITNAVNEVFEFTMNSGGDDFE